MNGSYKLVPHASIIQLSDLHFGAAKQNAHPSGLLVEHVARLANSVHNPIILASGDITFKGEDAGYAEAKQFFDRLRGATNLERERFLFCPGNHDFRTNDNFRAFDAFTYSIRRDDMCSFSNSSCRLVTIDGLSFVLLNSAHHLSYQYGLVDVQALRKLDITAPANTIAVSHHHVIPSEEHDASTTRNAYELLTTLDDLSISVLLHGHQHVTRGTPIGKTPVHVFGVNSFNFAFPGGQNAVGVIEWGDTSVNFSRRIFMKDGFGSAAGRFETIDSVSIR